MNQWLLAFQVDNHETIILIFIYKVNKIMSSRLLAYLMACCMRQNDLDRMQLPDSIRWRVQAAMPVILPSVRFSFSCQPPSVPSSALVSLQHSNANTASNSSSLNTRNSVLLSRTAVTISGKSKQQDNDFEVDPWTLLEDGAGSGPSASNTASMGSSDHVNLRAASWLRGTTRVRRTDLTYIGAVDGES